MPNISRSDNINELAEALAVAQGSIENAIKDASNPFFKNKYADLASVWDAVRKPLSDNKLSVIQPVSVEGQAVTVTTILAHGSGQWISADLTMNSAKSDPQAIGSCITYARRYALSSIVGVAPADDDGEGASGRTTGTKEAARAVAEAKLKGKQPEDRMPDDPPPSTLHDDIAYNPASQTKSEKKATTPFNALKAFGDLKKRFAKLGKEDVYYTILPKWGVEKSNQFDGTPEGITAARGCYKELSLAVAELEAAAAKGNDAAEVDKLPDPVECVLNAQFRWQGKLYRVVDSDEGQRWQEVK